MNINTAANQYANRPPDERYPTVDAMIAAARHDQEHSAEKVYNLKDLRAVSTKINQADTTDRLMLASPKGHAEFTHWSFGQLARTIGAPASYLRSLPPALAADCVNHGLASSPAGTTANLLVKANGGTPIIRACTSETYGRVHDAALYDAVRTSIMQDGKWTTPPTWSGEPAGAYRGDRDSFLILCNGGSIVKDPSLYNTIGSNAGQGSGVSASGSTDAMYRGLMLRNSEVGAASLWIEQVYYRYICGNHIIWGAVIGNTFRRRHVGAKVLRDTIQEISRIAWTWSNASAARDEAIIANLIANEVAHTKDAVIDELVKIGASKKDAERAYGLAESKESASPRSYWGLAQGLTRLSQDQSQGWQDDRLSLDQLAGQLLAIGVKKAGTLARV